MSKTFKGVRAVALACITLVLAASFTVVGVSQTAPAAAAGFDPGNIISDETFFNSGTMSEAQIQSFLNGKVSKCATGSSCLKDHSQDTWTREADAMCRGYAGAPNESAARIIHKVAQSCGVNPQAILVMLQKEQGLVNDSSPSAWAWKASMGYACPDTAACDTRYYGFFNQVYMGIWQLKRYGNPPGTSNYFTWFPIGKAAPIRFSPDASCGSSNVVVQNKATAALYYYTPYQPNAAAVAAGYGASSDPCSAYGNRNFYNYFKDWFGVPTADVSSPVGNFETATASINRVRVSGWVLDPDTADPIDIHVYVDGVVAGGFRADTARADVGAVYPGKGNNHGFDATVGITPGRHNVCVFGYNVGAGKNTSLGCKTVTTPVGSPYGNLEGLRAEGANALLSGWAIDPDTQNAVDLHVYVNGGWGGQLLADRERTDVGALNPGYGNRHGFDGSVPLTNGKNEVCVFAINVGVGANVSLGCRVVQGPVGGPPEGNFEQITPLNGRAEVTGWAVDPDTASPIDVHVYVNGVGAGSFRADHARADVAAAYPGYGLNHGIKATFAVPPGISNVCVFAINVGSGANSMLGCRDVAGATGPPFGNYEGVSLVDGKAKVSGWSIDPDTASPIDLHVYANGRFAGVITAGHARPDVGALNPGYGDRHGFSDSVPIPSGASDVCVYAINVGGGNTNPLLGCKTVKWGSGSPIGNFEGVTITDGALRVSGWSIDPDSPAPIDMHVYVNGAWGGLVKADQSRPDVGAVYPAYGANHGFVGDLLARPGTNNVCVFAFNVGAGTNTSLGCRTVQR